MIIDACCRHLRSSKRGFACGFAMFLDLFFDMTLHILVPICDLS